MTEKSENLWFCLKYVCFRTLKKCKEPPTKPSVTIMGCYCCYIVVAVTNSTTLKYLKRQIQKNHSGK